LVQQFCRHIIGLILTDSPSALYTFHDSDSLYYFHKYNKNTSHIQQACLKKTINYHSPFTIK
jgi:hypothetical protein